jgi:hypothetical protein
MPEVSRFYGIIVRFYYRDHPPTPIATRALRNIANIFGRRDQPALDRNIHCARSRMLQLAIASLAILRNFFS